MTEEPDEKPKPRPSPAMFGRHKRPARPAHGGGKPHGGKPEKEPRARPSSKAVTGPLPAVGPLGRLLSVHPKGDGTTDRPVLVGVEDSSNPLIVLRRTAFPTPGDDGPAFPVAAKAALMGWADEKNLGQDPELVAQVARRRSHALAALEKAGKTVRRVDLTPEWRLAVGLGERANAHEVGLALHGCYGWPQIPGSTLKGATAQWAWEEQVDRDDPESVQRFLDVFGAPLPDWKEEQRRKENGKEDQKGKAAGQEQAEAAERRSAARGRVRFLDALPSGGKVTVTADVMTPHVKPYRDALMSDKAKPEELVPPAEHHQPVPVSFLTVSGGTFTADLVADDTGTADLACAWLKAAVDDIGVGAKTSAGYGYLTANDHRR
ncbi:hypothetical protein GCM10009605_03090 [Nocardiopsis composta]